MNKSMVKRRSRRGGKTKRFYNKVSKLVEKFLRRLMFLRQRKNARKEDIICFQMGKVGSQTVYHSLISAYNKIDLNVEVHHLHRLGGSDDDEEKLIRKKRNPKLALGHHRLCQAFSKRMLENPYKKWNLVSMVREPVSRNVSVFFHTLEEFVPGWLDRYDKGTLDVEELLDLFLSNNMHDVADYWFDEQMKEVFGIDVYATEFPKEQGYDTYNESGDTPLLLMRLENLNLCGGKAMEKFFGLKNFTLVDSNVGDDKHYSKPYQDFKKQISLPMEYVNRICNTKFARHFYTDEELEGVIKKWTKSKIN